MCSYKNIHKLLQKNSRVMQSSKHHEKYFSSKKLTGYHGNSI